METINQGWKKDIEYGNHNKQLGLQQGIIESFR